MMMQSGRWTSSSRTYTSKCLKQRRCISKFRNPLFFGSYSVWPIGVTKEMYKNLDAPVGRSIYSASSPSSTSTTTCRLYMAGEAYSLDFFGTICGAQDRLDAGSN